MRYNVSLGCNVNNNNNTNNNGNGKKLIIIIIIMIIILKSFTPKARFKVTVHLQWCLK